MKIICGFQYELYTTDEQRSALSRNAGCRRFVFNKALELQNERKKNSLSLLRYKELCLELVKWKKEEKTVFLKEAMSQPLQQALKDLDRAIADIFVLRAILPVKNGRNLNPKISETAFAFRSSSLNISMMLTAA